MTLSHAFAHAYYSGIVTEFQMFYPQILSY